MSTRDYGNPPLIYSEGTKTNPSTGDVLATTGAIEKGGTYEVRVVTGASAAALVTVQRRAVGNGSNVGVTVPIRCPAGGSAEFILNYRVETSEHLRVVVTGFTGDAEAVIQIEELT